MTGTRILTRKDVETLLTPARAVEAVDQAFRAFATEAARMPPKVYLDLPEHDGDFRAMPSFLRDEHGEAAGLKWVNSHAQNPSRFGMPSVMALFVLSDPKNAFPLAVLDATWLTAARTGAAAAVASRALGPKTPRSIGFVGCGIQARTMLAAHRVLFDDIEIRCTDVDADAAEAFAKNAGGAVVTLEEAAKSDIICIATPSRKPIVLKAHVHPGSHINAMGADAPGKQELEPALLKAARVFVDDWEQASHSGEINVPLEAGLLQREDVAGPVGDVLFGKAEGRQRDDDITIFDSTGLAVQDLACAQLVFQAAQREGLGQIVDFLG